MSATRPQSPSPNPTELLNLSAAGSLLGLTVWQLRGLIASRSLPVVQVGRKFYLRRTTLLRWTERAEGLVRQ
jgi:excisionase family DNA binding protein